MVWYVMMVYSSTLGIHSLRLYVLVHGIVGYGVLQYGILYHNDWYRIALCLINILEHTMIVCYNITSYNKVICVKHDMYVNIYIYRERERDRYIHISYTCMRLPVRGPHMKRLTKELTLSTCHV